jgi:hypothetical protein
VRQLASLLVVAGLLAIAPVASAGSYDVIACVGAAGGAQNSFAAVADPGMAAYTICPNRPNEVASGLVTRASATAGPGSVPYLAGAYQIFEAPPGASVASVSFDLAAIRLAPYWTTGIVAYDGNFNAGDLPYGCYAGTPGCTIGSRSFFGPAVVPLNGHARFRFETRCVNVGRCDISASGFQPGMRALFSAANVVVRVQDFTPPSIVPVRGALWQDGWHRGLEEAWQSLTDNVGILMLRLYVDGALEEEQDFRNPIWPGVIRCDFTRRRPCADILPGGVFLDTRTLADGRHTIRVESLDAAGNVSAIERQIDTDNTAPAPVSLGVEGGDGWRTRDQFTLRWQARRDDAAPVVFAHYTICPVKDPGACSRGRQEVAGVEQLSVKAPSPGEYTVRLWLEDAAGNASEAGASPPVRLRFDDQPPEAVFEPMDNQTPLQVTARVRDAGSGLAAASVEMRRVGWRQWQELDTTLNPDTLSAQVNDLGFPDGRYELRAIVRDHAGNERIGDRLADGSRMQLSLPLRTVSRVSASVRRCRRARSGKRCRRATVLRGAGGVVSGRVETPNGGAIPHARLTVVEQGRDGSERSSAVVAGADGRYAVNLRNGVSRVVRLRFAGNAKIKPAEARLEVLVPGRTTLSATPRRLHNGQAVRFRGRLLGGPIPRGGKLIDLQAFYRRSWRTFATPRSDRRGRWRFRYRFGATRGVVTYRFRARVRREAAYPYELGHSRVVRVTVRG